MSKWDESAHHRPEDFDVSDTEQIWELVANGELFADVESDWDANFEAQQARLFVIDKNGLRSMNLERVLLNLHQRVLVLEGKLPGLTRESA